MMGHFDAINPDADEFDLQNRESLLMRDRKPVGSLLWAVLFVVAATFGFNGCGNVNDVASTTPPPPQPGPLKITSTSLLIGVVGQPYADTLGGSGGTTPYAWSVTPALPAGLSLNPTTGTITSTPLPTATSSQLHTFTLKDSSSPQQQVQKSLTLTVVNPPPVLTILTTSLPNATVPQSYLEPLQAFGGTPPLTWSLIAGPLPPNFTLDSTTGEIAAPPTTVGDAGLYNFTIRVTDSAGQVDDQALSIRIVLAPPTITTTSLPGGTVGIGYSRQVQATGGTGALTWSISAGTLPPPLTINPATGVIFGTPGSSGTFNFTVQVTDALSLSDTQALSITIAAAPIPPNITTPSLPGGTVGTPYSQPVLATGGTGARTWSISVGNLPPPLSINPSTGVISGTPNAPGTFNFTVEVTDSLSLSDTKALSIVVVNPPPPTITSTSPLPGGTVGTAYNQTLRATGGTGSRVWGVTSGSLPSNLFLNPTTGVISGTPTSAGTSNFTVQVTDALSLSDTQALSITIAAAPIPPNITTPSLPGGTVGTPYSQPVLATGGTGARTWSISVGNLPPPLSINPATGVISGTPNTSGTFNFTVQVTDSLSLSDTVPLSIVISSSAPNITTTTLPNGTVGTGYNQPLAATGGVGTLVWSPISGSLPANLSLSPSGVISGTPTGTGTANFTVQVTDGFSQTDTQALSITIVAAPVPLTITTISPLPDGKVGDDYGTVTPAAPVTLTVSGGTPPYTWSTTVTPLLPAGLSIDAAGTISGTPTVDETNIDHTFTVTDSASTPANVNKALSLTIAP